MLWTSEPSQRYKANSGATSMSPRLDSLHIFPLLLNVDEGDHDGVKDPSALR